MRCSCRVCGAYMVQREKGIESGCVCPDCLNTCTMCTMSDGGTPKSTADLALAYSFRRQESDENDASPFSGPISPEEYVD